MRRSWKWKFRRVTGRPNLAKMQLRSYAVTQLYSFVCTEAKLWKLLICAQRPYVLEGKLYFQLLAWLCKWLNKERTNVLVDYGQMKLPTCDCWVLRQYLPAIHMLSLSPNIPKWNPCSLPLCDPWIPCPPLHWAHGVTFVTEKIEDKKFIEVLLS